MRETEAPSGGRLSLGWLFEVAPRTERTIRMEALIGRLRLVIVAINIVLLLLFFDTSSWHMGLTWMLIGGTLLYAVPVAVFQPYKRWPAFGASMWTATLDSAAIALFIFSTGGASSPFFPLYYLSVAAVAMRFDLRQAMAAVGIYAATYALAYFLWWDPSADAMGVLLMRCAYIFLIGVAVGHLAREENTRAREVEEIERLNAENAKLLSKREREARVDRLTGLTTRAAMEKDAHRLLRRARQAGGYLSVLFCDMDRLKAINDELGHEAGDRVLRAAGQAIKRSLRAQDLVGRYGGDEFVVVLPNLTRETAFERADQLIAGINGVNDVLPDDLRVGLSVGIATYPFDAGDYATLVKLADQAMYLAKRDGGARVRTSTDLRLFWETIPKSA